MSQCDKKWHLEENSNDHVKCRYAICMLKIIAFSEENQENLNIICIIKRSTNDETVETEEYYIIEQI